MLVAPTCSSCAACFLVPQAWQHGLVSDNSTEWARRLGQLQQYVAT